MKGKSWRSLDLANQLQTNIISQNPTTSTTVTTVTSTIISSTTSLHHNPLITYQRHDFKNRRSSSEPANEQKLITPNTNHSNHIQSCLKNTTTSNQNSCNASNSTSLAVHDEPYNESDDEFIDCVHQKSNKVSKLQSPPNNLSTHLVLT